MRRYACEKGAGHGRTGAVVRAQHVAAYEGVLGEKEGKGRGGCLALSLSLLCLCLCASLFIPAPPFPRSLPFFLRTCTCGCSEAQWRM
jgi:hypothetical protein